jgi:hypothetical protein
MTAAAYDRMLILRGGGSEVAAVWSGSTLVGQATGPARSAGTKGPLRPDTPRSCVKRTPAAIRLVAHRFGKR